MSINKPKPEVANRSIRDSVYGYVEVPWELVKVIDHPLVQRLRNVSSTGFAYHVYPGLEGTEFSHALGSMHLAGECWRWLWQRTADQELFEAAVRADLPLDLTASDDVDFERQLLLAIQLMSLLRSVGSPPYSYVLHKFMDRWPQLFVHGITNAMDADFIARKFSRNSIVPATTIVSRMLRRVLASECAHGLEIAWWIVACVDADRDGVFTWAKPIESLMNGGIDTHRMDYLVRDSSRAGAEEFGALDISRLARSFFLHRTGKEWRLALHARARSAIEGFIAQRIQFHRWIHHHSHVAIIDAYFEIAVELVYELGEQKSVIGLELKELRPNLQLVTTRGDSDTRAGAPSTQVDDITTVGWLRRSTAAVVQRQGQMPADWRYDHALALFRATLHRTPNWVSVWDNEIEFAHIAEATSASLNILCNELLKLLLSLPEPRSERVQFLLDQISAASVFYEAHSSVQAMNLLADLLFSHHRSNHADLAVREFNRFYNSMEQTRSPRGRWIFVYTRYTRTDEILHGSYFGLPGSVTPLLDQFPSVNEASSAESRIERFYATYIAYDSDDLRYTSQRDGKDAITSEFISLFPKHLSAFFWSGVAGIVSR